MISVCLATYNGAKFIKAQLDSIIPQLAAGDEIVISDDGSTDNTVSIVSAFNSPLIRLIQGPQQHDPIKNFEHALYNSRGDIIFLADQDDVWADGKVKTLVAALTDCDCVVSDCYVTNGELCVTSDSFYATNHTRHSHLYNLFVRNGYLGCCMAFRREVLTRALPFPSSIPMHDIWIGNVAATFFRLHFIPERLIYFRRHSHNASPTAKISTYSLPKKLLFRLTIVKLLLQRSFQKPVTV